MKSHISEQYLSGPETCKTHNYYCSYDGQGNVSRVSNMAGDMPYNLYAYDSYGTQTGSDYSNESFSSYKGYDKGPFGYKTGVRQYDPETGRFLSPDAFKGRMADPPSQHPYMYSRGNPIKYSDPSGYDYIIFNGKGLYWFHDNNKGVVSWGANSGKFTPFDPSKQNIKDKGPTVEGKYMINPASIDVRKNHEKPDDTYGKIRSWGPERVQMIPDIDTEKRIKGFGRIGQFFIHGGYDIGTGGCIEIADYSEEQIKEGKFFEHLRNYGKPIEVRVIYPKSNSPFNYQTQ